MPRASDQVPISFLASKTLARKLYLVALRSGLSQSEILRRILEAELTKIEQEGTIA